jgi:hypothetical protein
MSKIKFLRMFSRREFSGSLKLTPAYDSPPKNSIRTVNKNFRSRICPKASTASLGTRPRTKMQAIEPNLSDIHSKLRRFMKTSPKSLEEVFREKDVDGNNNLTNIEFRGAIRNLGIGLTSSEIDTLIQFCVSDAENKINWVDFIYKFQQR